MQISHSRCDMPRYVEGGHGDRAKAGGNGAGHANTWHHSDRVLVDDGIVFNVRYIGCLEIRASMKLLDFNTRSQVAKECINRVCEAASLITPKKRRVDKRIEQCMSEAPLMKHTGTDVKLTVCSKYLLLMNLETNEVLSQHDMPRISFASGGDTDTLDFVAFVAKQPDEWRACYVLECGGGLAKTLISTIGQAFDLRYNEYFVKSQETENLNTDKEYYNDLPDKLPPEMMEADNGVCGGGGAAGGAAAAKGSASGSISIAAHKKKTRDRLSSNLIDLNSPPHDHDYVNDQQLDAALAASVSASGNGVVLAASNGGPSTIGSSATAATTTTATAASPRDVFDMRKYSQRIVQYSDQGLIGVFAAEPFANTFNSLTAEVQRSQLLTEIWFHGLISRPVAEAMLKSDGEFLVRESRAKPGQYVLTGMQTATPKHLLLIDPAGVVSGMGSVKLREYEFTGGILCAIFHQVRTKDRFFDSISHLINYHWTNALPIISEESSLVLRYPVQRSINQRPT